MTNELTADQAEQIRTAVAEAVSAAVRGPTDDTADTADTAPTADTADTTTAPDLLLVIDAASIGAAHADSLLQESIAAARHAGHSWSEIGARLGVSKQAAQQRYPTGDPAAAAPNQKLLKPVTAFTEMGELSKAGREGWHSVGFGMLYHLLEESSQQWEHHRQAFPRPGTRKRLEAQGWQHIGTVYPWQYFKRPLGSLR